MIYPRPPVPVDTSELDTLPMIEIAAPIPLPVEELHTVSFCTVCGCSYLDGCKEHQA